MKIDNHLNFQTGAKDFNQITNYVVDYLNPVKFKQKIIFIQ